MTKQLYAFWHMQFKSVKSATATKSEIKKVKSGAQELRKSNDFLNGQTGLYHNILFLAHFNTELLVLFDMNYYWGVFLVLPHNSIRLCHYVLDSHGLGYSLRLWQVDMDMLVDSDASLAQLQGECSCCHTPLPLCGEHPPGMVPSTILRHQVIYLPNPGPPGNSWPYSKSLHFKIRKRWKKFPSLGNVFVEWKKKKLNQVLRIFFLKGLKCILISSCCIISFLRKTSKVLGTNQTWYTNKKCTA